MSENIFDNINDPNELSMKHQDLMDELDLLEKEFKILKEKLKNETAPELIELSKKLDTIKHNKITSQKFRRRFRINSVWNEYLSEVYSFERMARIEKSKFKEQLRDEIKKNLNQIDRQVSRLRNCKSFAPAAGSSEDTKPIVAVSKRLTLIDKLNQRKIAPISPDSPYLVYNLDDDQIEHDLSLINEQYLASHDHVLMH